MRLRELKKYIEDLVASGGGGGSEVVTVEALGTIPVANSFNTRQTIVSVPVKGGNFYVASYQVGSAVGPQTDGTQLSYGIEAPTSESPQNWQSNAMSIVDDGSGVDHQWSTQVIHILTDGVIAVGAYTIGPTANESLPGDPGDASLTDVKLVVKEL